MNIKMEFISILHETWDAMKNKSIVRKDIMDKMLLYILFTADQYSLETLFAAAKNDKIYQGNVSFGKTQHSQIYYFLSSSKTTK